MYHEIADQSISTNLKNTLQSTYIIDVEKFKSQIEYLVYNNYSTITIDAYLDYLKNNCIISKRPILITFDDGFKGNFKFALPILREYGLKATIFVRVDKVGQPNYLSWNEIDEMINNDISIQSHSYSHPYLSTVSTEFLKNEILKSKEILEYETGRRVKHFCYPMGDYSRTVINCLIQYGYKSAFSSRYGISTDIKERYRIKRIKVGTDLGLTQFKKIIDHSDPIHTRMAIRSFILDSIKKIMGAKNYGKLYSKIFNVKI